MASAVKKTTKKATSKKKSASAKKTKKKVTKKPNSRQRKARSSGASRKKSKVAKKGGAKAKPTLKDLLNKVDKKASKEKKPPLNELNKVFHEHWDREECKKHLYDYSEANIDDYINRKQYADDTGVADATWTRYFGTFQEFKRQAGVDFTRQQAALERHIAKHASVDHYRQISIDRLDYGESYLRENGKRFKLILVLSDLHDIECDRFYLRVAIDTALRTQPDVICLNGDLFDLAEFGRYITDPRDWDVVGRIRFVHEEILRPLREVCPDAQIDLIEGNHEARLLRHLADSTPALKAVLSDLHGWDVPQLLGLTEFEVNYIAQADLGAFTKRDAKQELQKNYKIYYDSVLAHHFPVGKKYQMPGWNGHHHKFKVDQFHNIQFGDYLWYQVAGGHRRDAEYCDGSKWSNGFLLANIDTQTKTTCFEPVEMHDFCRSAGKLYYRHDDE